MIHTLEAVGIDGTVYSFASLIRCRARLRKYGDCWYLKPVSGTWRAVTLRKRSPAAIWRDILDTMPTWPRPQWATSRYDKDALRYRRDGEELYVQQLGRGIRKPTPPVLLDAIPSYRRWSDPSIVADQKDLIAQEAPDETVKRLGLDATFFNSGHIRAAGIAREQFCDTAARLARRMTDAGL